MGLLAAFVARTWAIQTALEHAQRTAGLQTAFAGLQKLDRIEQGNSCSITYHRSSSSHVPWLTGVVRSVAWAEKQSGCAPV